MCGIIGMFGSKDVFSELYSGLLTLQHRGQDAAGVITYKNGFHVKKGLGEVKEVFGTKHLRRLVGNIGIGHVRYSTIGKGGAEDVQPFYVDKPYGIALAHNGNVTNYGSLREELSRKHYRRLSSSCDAEVILCVLAEELLTQDLTRFSYKKAFVAVKKVFEKVEGSYSVVADIGNKGLLVFRDPHGIKPLCFGRRGKDYCFASESVALDVLGYRFERDVRPGEAIFVDRKRRFFSQQITNKIHYPCIFEYVYFARPDSIIDSISVYEARMGLGEELAEEVRKRGIRPDVAIPIPDTSRAAALSLAGTLGIPYREGLIKNRYIGRTFIMSSQERGQSKVRMKLNPIRREIEGKKVLLVDDSIVRGATSEMIIELVKKAGARKVYFVSSSPPLRYPCPYGIDMQTRGEFIARDKSELEIQKKVGSDILVYQSLEGLIKGVRGNSTQRKFCTACFDGNYPTHISEESLGEMEQERMRVRR